MKKKTVSKKTETKAPAKKPAPVEDDIVRIVKENLRIMRQISGLSLDKLAAKCGVSRAMLSQIEQGKSTPTISVLWKIATGLNIPFSELLRDKTIGEVTIIKHNNSKVLYSNSKVFSSRALFPFHSGRKAEFYELILAPGGVEIAEPHQPGTTENIVLISGRLKVRVEEKVYDLEPRDSIYFQADVPHEYLNPGDQEALMYLVMTYSREIN